MLDSARLRRQAVFTEDNWCVQPKEDDSCAFLGTDGRCRVYEYRPMACRKYFVASDPASCDLRSNPKGKVLRWFTPAAEVITTAVFTEFGVNSMPVQLLAALDKSEKQRKAE